MPTEWGPFMPLIIMVPLQLATLAGVIWWVRRWSRGRRAAVGAGPVALGPDAYSIPVLATFTGVRGMPWWYAVASNNANPRLEIGPAGLTFRVIRRRQLPFAAIERIDVRTAPLTCNLTIAFVGELLMFSANLGTPAAAGMALRLFPGSVPLTPRAQALRDASGTDTTGPSSPA